MARRGMTETEGTTETDGEKQRIMVEKLGEGQRGRKKERQAETDNQGRQTEAGRGTEREREGGVEYFSVCNPYLLHSRADWCMVRRMLSSHRNRTCFCDSPATGFDTQAKKPRICHTQ